jgi:hypothetical protein
VHFLAIAFLAITYFLVQRMRHNRNRRPYELRNCDKCDCTMFRMRNTFCWTVRFMRDEHFVK